jgi:hypothetical protein
VTTPTYVVTLAAVPVGQIDLLRSEAGRGNAGELVLTASRVETCPHDLIAVEVSPLGRVLSEALDIGQPLRSDVWHPLRGPVVVDPETVMARAMALDEACREAADQLGGMMAEVLGADIERVRRLYTHASRRAEAVVSFLSAPPTGPGASGATVPRIVLDADADADADAGQPQPSPAG